MLRLTASIAGLIASAAPAAGAMAQEFPSRPIKLIIGFAPGQLGRRDEPDRRGGNGQRPRPAGDRGGAAGRVEQHRRRRRDQGRARRLHAVPRLGRQHHQPRDQGRRLGRYRQGPEGDRSRVRGAQHPGRQHGREGRQREGTDRARQGGAGQAQLRLAGSRHDPASVGRIVQCDGRREDGARALQGHRAGSAGPARRHPARDVRAVLDRAGADRGQEVARAGVDDHHARAGAADVPTISEAGLPGFDTSIWFGINAPAATPAAVADKLGAALVGAVKSDAVTKAFRVQGIEPSAVLAYRSSSCPWRTGRNGTRARGSALAIRWHRQAPDAGARAGSAATGRPRTATARRTGATPSASWARAGPQRPAPRARPSQPARTRPRRGYSQPESDRPASPAGVGHRHENGGVADGSIMASIMVHHMTIMPAPSHGPGRLRHGGHGNAQAQRFDPGRRAPSASSPTPTCPCPRRERWPWPMRPSAPPTPSRSRARRTPLWSAARSGCQRLQRRHIRVPQILRHGL